MSVSLIESNQSLLLILSFGGSAETLKEQNVCAIQRALPAMKSGRKSASQCVAVSENAAQKVKRLHCKCEIKLSKAANICLFSQHLWVVNNHVKTSV